MKNPWLTIPLADYEAHMALPEVAQAATLADVLAEALREHRPRAVAVLGCAGGNGFERISPADTPRVVGVDLNPAYIEEARRRFGGRIPQLELFAGDVQTDRFGFAPVELVFAGLLFEYVDLDATLGAIRGMLVPNGVLVTVVQLACAAVPEVTPSAYTSLAALAPLMRLVEPDALARAAARAGFVQAAARTVEAGSRKRFCVQAFRRTAA